MEKALKNYKDIDTHVSKVINHGQVYIQAVFAEKSFTGSSLLSAKQFYDKLSESNYGVERIELKLSGSYYVKGQAGSTVNLVFGTLGGVLLLFGAIIAFYHTGLAENDIFKRFVTKSHQLMISFHFLIISELVWVPIKCQGWMSFSQELDTTDKEAT